MVYGVAHGEIASINCSVKANPTSGIRFRWTFNSSAELNTLPESRYTSHGPTSQVSLKVLRSEQRKTGHVQKLATNKKSTLFVQSL